MTVLSNRIEFVYFFDVTNGNPNGDPDMGNMPRTDPGTQRGLVTDVCLKRKIRNFVALVNGDKAPHKIFIKEKAILNHLIQEPYQVDLETKEAFDCYQAWQKNKKLKKPEKHPEDIACDWMCKNYFDVRTFGAVMSTGSKDANDTSDEKGSKIKKTAGQVRGPVQITFAQSLDQILPLPISITRMAVTTEVDADKQGGGNRTMGEKYIVPYGLYRCHGFISPHFARRTGFSEADLELLWQALSNMFDHDHSAARGEMTARSLISFRHATDIGNAPAHKLFDLVKAERVNPADPKPVRSFTDYAVTFDRARLPANVTAVEHL
ncbi:CRISPR-associated protein Csd2 [uncultured Gammaproteobacteria bacterium]